MWGSWYTTIFGGLLVALLIVAIAFGTSALLFPVLIVIGIGVVAGGVAILRGTGSAEEDRARTKDPRSRAAPASGEGSGSPTSPTGPTS